jgi:hypothetical protein
MTTISPTSLAPACVAGASSAHARVANVRQVVASANVSADVLVIVRFPSAPKKAPQGLASPAPGVLEQA